MGKVVKLKLTEAGVTFSHPLIAKNVTIRSEELSLLATCFEFQAQQEKSYKNVNLCIDCSEEIRSIDDAKEFVTLTKPDLDLFKKGFEGTAERRPLAWVYCRNLLRQLEDPVEESIDEETKQG